MGVELDTLEVKVESSAEQASAGIDKLTATLKRLKEATKGGAGLQTVANQISKLNTALSGVTVNAGKIGEIAKALNGLSSVQKASGLTSTVNALKKLPAITDALEAANLDRFAVQMERVANAVRPLATEMQKVSNGFSAFPIRIQKIISSNTSLAASNNKAAKSFSVLGMGISSLQAKFGIYYVVFRRIAFSLAYCVTSINEYVENVNLFQVSMGDFYQEAFDYAQLVSNKLGIDPSEWMRTQGVFMSMANGFGLAKQQAYDLSEGLTELTYDIGSLYNDENFETSAQRLQSALAGEIEPIRRLGISISQATLQEYALSKGITESVSSMTEQEKALLRSLKLMEGAAKIGAVGDFAKTLESPANALRVLNQQITQFKRAIGSVMLPAIVQILPYVQAIVSLLTEWIQRLAVLVGFTMPEWDTRDWASGITSGAGDATESVGDATKAVKELKNATLGIDELNIISPNSGSAGAGAGGASGWASDLEIPNVWDKEALARIQTQADEIKKKLEPILKTALAIGAAFLAWKIASGLMKDVFFVSGGISAIGKAMKWLATLGPVQAILSKIGGALAAMTIQFHAAGGGIKGFLSVAGLIAKTFAPAIAIFVVIISTLKVLRERWDDIKTAVSNIFEKLNISERLEGLRTKLDELGQKLGWVNGFWDGLKSAIGAVMDLIGGTVITLIGSTLIGVLNGLIEVVSGLISIVDGVLTILIGLKDFIVGVFTGDLKLAGEGVNAIGEGIQQVFGGLWQAVVGGVTQFVNGVINSISELGGTLLHEKIPEILQGFVDWWGDVVSFFTKAVPQWWDDTISPWFTIEKWKELGKQAIDGLLSGIGDLWEKGKELGSKLIGGFRSKDALDSHSPSVAFASAGFDAVSGFSKGFGDMSGIVTVTKTALSSMLTETTAFSNSVGLSIQTIHNDFLTSIDSAETRNISFNNTMKRNYQTMSNASVSAIKNIISYLDSIPRNITTVHTIITQSVSGGASKTRGYASGGFPEMGQLFLAREAGPELVGTIGGRSAVANNAQIVAGIASGVRDANAEQNALLRRQNELLMAILEKEGTTVSLDGKTLKRAVDKASRESGANIMSGGVRG